MFTMLTNSEGYGGFFFEKRRPVTDVFLGSAPFSNFCQHPHTETFKYLSFPT